MPELSRTVPSCEQDAVDVAKWAVKQHANATRHSLPFGGLRDRRRWARMAGSKINDLAGRVVGDGQCLDERQLRGFQTMDGYGIAGVDREGERRRQMRGRLDLCPVGQDKTIDIAGWGQSEKLNLAAIGRQLVWIIRLRTVLRVDGSRDHERREEDCKRPHRKTPPYRRAELFKHYANE